MLGTQVPVAVSHNATLIARFLVCISEVLAGNEKHLTLLDVWRRVQSTNVIFDALHENPIHGTSRRAENRQAVSTEFMTQRSVGRLRAGDVYADSEEVLAEMADDRGVGERVRGCLKSPGYLPESLFYVFAGRPERIYLRSLFEAIDPKPR